MTVWQWVGPLAVSGIVSLLGVRLVEKCADRLGLVDLPNARSSHHSPKPRGGGVGVIAGAVAGLSAAAWLGPGIDVRVWAVLAGACVVAASGLWDDVRRLGILPRLATQVSVACGLVWMLGGFTHLPLPGPLDVGVGSIGGGLMAVVWIVGVTNFFNFMDGADGLAGGQASMSFALIAWALWPSGPAVLALVSAAASVVFLTSNWEPARIFLGDVGSSWMGFLLAALSLAAPAGQREDLVIVVAISLALFLLDPVVTLVSRAGRRAPIGQAHREHAYQRLFEPGQLHAPVVGRLLAVAVALTLCAAAAWVNERLAWPATGAALVAFGIEWRIAAGGSLRRSGDERGRRRGAD